MTLPPKCYRCGDRRHKAIACALPEGVCSICHQSGHTRGKCSPVYTLCDELWLIILSYLQISDLLQVRLVCSKLQSVMCDLPWETHCDFHNRKADKVLKYCVLPGEPFLRKINSELGLNMLYRHLVAKTLTTAIGRANVFRFMHTKPPSKPLTEQQYLKSFPRCSSDDYNFYLHQIFPTRDAHDEWERKQEYKMEVKALKFLYRRLCIKYALIEKTDYRELLDKKKYAVVLHDKNFIRRVHSDVHYLASKSKPKDIDN